MRFVARFVAAVAAIGYTCRTNALLLHSVPKFGIVELGSYMMMMNPPLLVSPCLFSR